MADEELLKILQQGAAAWNKWRMENHGSRIDLSGASLREVDLNAANLGEARLDGANLFRANLLVANLEGADLTEANLSETDLRGVDLRKANLRGAWLNGAHLNKANLNMANLSEACLNGAHLSKTALNEANLSKARLIGADLSGASLKGANLREANLSRANLSDANLEGAILAGCNIYAISAWGLKLKSTMQKDLVITPQGEPVITVDNLEVAQFIYILIHNEKIRDVIDTVAKKVVLILGRFTEDRKPVLTAIKGKLRDIGYLPVVFDFKPPAERNTLETVTLLARLSRFIIADITEPRSVPQELAAIVPNLPSVPVMPIIQEGHEPWGMYDSIKCHPWVLGLQYYSDVDSLLNSFEENIIDPAINKANELRAGHYRQF
jgi:hypothetical protein